MQLNSDTPLAVELRDREIREHTVASQIKIGLPFQIRGMREHRGWTQEKLAEKIGTTQNTISRLENPRTGKPTITTLMRIANACDVGLLVRFVPFGFYGDVIQAMDPDHVEVPSYDEERDRQSKSEAEKLADTDQADRGGVLTQSFVDRSPASGWNRIADAIHGLVFFQNISDMPARMISQNTAVPLKLQVVYKNPNLPQSRKDMNIAETSSVIIETSQQRTIGYGNRQYK